MSRIKESIQEDLRSGAKTIDDLSMTSIKAEENNPVLSDEDHTGIRNQATLKIEAEGKAKYNLESNVVTVKPNVPEKFDIPVEKVWDEFMGDSSKRPTSITIKLMKNGELLESRVLTEADNWKTIFRNLDKTDKAGNEITYTVEEAEVEYYYSDTLWTDTSYKVTNHTRPWIPRLPSTPGNVGHVRVTKTVSGAADAKTDYEITVKFTYPHDGGEYTHTLMLNPTDNPSFFFDYIPTGTVIEISEKEGDYSMTCTADKKETTTFIVEIGKTHEVAINNDKPGTPTNTGDNNRLVEWMILTVLTALTALALVYRRKLRKDARK